MIVMIITFILAINNFVIAHFHNYRLSQVSNCKYVIVFTIYIIMISVYYPAISMNTIIP